MCEAVSSKCMPLLSPSDKQTGTLIVAALSRPRAMFHAKPRAVSEALPFDMDSRALWLTLQSERDWWSVDDLVHHWRPTFTDFEVDERLRALHAGGFIERSLFDLLRSNKPVYAVTSKCHELPGAPVPGRWVSVGEGDCR